MKKSKTGTYMVRPITPNDDEQLAAVIRGCFIDYDATQEGTVFSDSIIDRLSASYLDDRSQYFVLEVEGKVEGGAGISRLAGADKDLCELQKMYLQKEARGQGFGSLLLDICLDFARNVGYKTCYLESLPELKDALRLYEHKGFQYIKERMGETGYYGCTLFMTIDLQAI